MNKKSQRHVLLIGLEFLPPLFSGNGILTHSITRGLLVHQGCKVTVICAQPDDITTPIVIDDHAFRDAMQRQNLHVIPIPVPSSKWRRLDRKSAWKEMSESVVSILAKRQPDFQSLNCVIGIDWSALPTYHTLLQHNFLSKEGKFVNFPFRIFSKSKELFEEDDDSTFYYQWELEGAKQAFSSIVISHVDQIEIMSLLEHHEICKQVNLLLPPLRDDILQLAKNMNGIPAATPSQKRIYITCNVRLSPEKNALFFAKIIHSLAQTGHLSKWGITPLLIGAACNDNYVQNVISMLPPETNVVTTFLPPTKLLSFLQKTKLLIHPPTYDAYGMIIAEAAAVGTPSIIHYENIGASSHFRSAENEIFMTDMTCLTSAIDMVIKIMEGQLVEEVGSNAKCRTMEWTTEEWADGLMNILENDDS